MVGNFSINYVLPCWFGDRRVKDSNYIADPLYYLKQHVDALQRFKHNLDQISIVVQIGPSIPYAHIIPETINGVKTKVFERPNIGLSYGALDFLYQHCRNSFDYYLFVEDDYHPNIDNFDAQLLAYMDDEVGYVCSLYKEDHAAISNGLLKAAALEKVLTLRGKLPHAPASQYEPNEHEGQIALSHAIFEAGYTVVDITDKYSIPFLNFRNEIVYYGNVAGQIFFKPTQLAHV